MRLTGEGTHILHDEDIAVGDIVFDVDAQIGVNKDTRFGSLDCRDAFVTKQRAEAGLVVGLGLIEIDCEILGFGVALNRTRIDVTVERPRGNTHIDYELDGPSVFVTFAIPGLKQGLREPRIIRIDRKSSSTRDQ